jgi:hypothetical protein
MATARPAVFISYSHLDEDWKDRLVSHLRVLEREGELDVWDDRRIGAGEDWRPEIEQAIAHATVAILIVSKDFLTSRFIREEELTRILARRSRQELKVVPVIAEPCAWQAVESLRGIQARPIDGRALSGGSEHQIDTDLAALALEIREAAAGARATPAPTLLSGATARPSHTFARALAVLPVALVALLALGASYWHVDTRVSLALVTKRMSFVVRGDRSHPLVNSSAQFSALSIERCREATLTAAQFARVIVPASAAGESAPHEGPVRLRCDDSDAKIRVAPPPGAEAPVGSLDRLDLGPGAHVVLSVAGTGQPVVTLDVSTAQNLSLPLRGDVRVVTDLVTVVPRLGPESSPAEYDVRLHDADRMLRVETGDRGTVLIVTPVPESVAGFFDADAALPIESLLFVDESVGGTTVTPFLGQGVLAYPEYPRAPPLDIAGDDFLVLQRTQEMELKGVAVDPQSVGLAVTVEGVLSEASIGPSSEARSGEGAAEGWLDPRLTLYQAVLYGPWWGGGTIVTLCIAATALLWYRSSPMSGGGKHR